MSASVDIASIVRSVDPGALPLRDGALAPPQDTADAPVSDPASSGEECDMSVHADRMERGDSDVDGRAHQLLLVPAPDVSAVIAGELARELPARLDEGRWRVAVDEEELLAEDFGELVEAARAARERTGADLAVCLTDVPLRAGRRPLTAALDADQGIGVVSVPATGAMLQRRRVKRTAEAVIAALTEQEAPTAEGGIRARPVELPEGHELRRGYTLPSGLGHARLLAGMVRANRPWRAFRTLSTAVIAALATGAYAVINASVWQISAALSPVRLLA